MKNIKNKMQKGFSLVELMVVIAIIAILAAVAIPMYSNYTARANVSSEISQLGGVKAEVAQQIANSTLTNGDAITGMTAAGMDVPQGTTVLDNGTINRVSTTVSGATISLVPALTSGAVTWSCQAGPVGTITASQVPSTCTIAAVPA